MINDNIKMGIEKVSRMKCLLCYVNLKERIYRDELWGIEIRKATCSICNNEWFDGDEYSLSHCGYGPRSWDLLHRHSEIDLTSLFEPLGSNDINDGLPTIW
jgi:hypothetical protein